MRPRDERSEYRSKIIDIEANRNAADSEPRAPQTFRERHALKVMGVVMAGLFVTVIVAQVGC